ncbi:MAG: metallophosphoesterase [Nitrososphaera sp.]
MKIRPIHPHAAILLECEGRKYIVVSDLHIGIEGDLLSKGITVGPSLVCDMITELSDLIQSEHADSIILLGDIKHSVSRITRQEWDTVPVFLKQLGNHDGNIRHLVPVNVNMITSKGMTLEDTLLMHGHTMPSDVRGHIRRIVMGHIHPVFLKKESVINGERVWLYLQARKEDLFAEKGLVDIVVVPTFNPYLYATGEKLYHKSGSPIITRVMQHGVIKCIVVTLDGSIIGDATLLTYIL